MSIIINNRLLQEQKTQLNMTMGLRRSLDLLQLSSLDLFSYLDDIAMDNPLLEIEIQHMSVERPKRNTMNKWQVVEDNFLQAIPAKPQTLYEFLLSQLQMMQIPKPIYRAAVFLVGSLDESGYLTIDLPDAAHILKMPLSVMEKALTTLQTLEPCGVGAKTLQECLLLQITKNPETNPMVVRLIEKHLPDLGKGKFTSIARSLGVPHEELMAAVSYLQTLNPRPGLAYSGIHNPYIIPDAEIVKEDERYIIRLCWRYLPRLSFNPTYETFLRANKNNDNCRPLLEKLQEAKDIIKSFEKRKSTLQRVIQAIVEKQPEFMENGVTSLRPMTLKLISERTGLHISTVSRTIRDKYVRTPLGIFELSYFFSKEIAVSDGSHTSNRKVQYRIKEMIQIENKKDPLSDQQIAILLNNEGLTISRRTVAKYRKEMRILSSVMRT